MEFFRKTALAALVMGFSGAALRDPLIISPKRNHV